MPPLTSAAMPITACKRRNRQAVAEGDRHGVEFAPMLGHDRLGAFRQFGAQPVELTDLLQERLVGFDAAGERDAGGADVRRIGEDLRHATSTRFWA